MGGRDGGEEDEGTGDWYILGGALGSETRRQAAEGENC